MNVTWKERLAWLRTLLRRTGFDVVRYDWRTNVNLRRQRFLDGLGIDCMLDIGANVGAYAAAVRQFGYRGEIISFEPTSDAYAELQVRSARDPLWKAERLAVAGSEGDRTIFVSANSVSSSLLERSEQMAESLPDSRYVKQESVRAITLDAALTAAGAARRPVWAKLDVQGSAHQILSATNGHLRDLAALEIELPFVEMYAGEGLFLDLMAQLQQSGFELVSLESNTFDPHGAVLEVNGILVRHGAWRKAR